MVEKNGLLAAEFQLLLPANYPPRSCRHAGYRRRPRERKNGRLKHENSHRASEPATGHRPCGGPRPRAHVSVFARRRATVDTETTRGLRPDAMRLCSQYVPDV